MNRVADWLKAPRVEGPITPGDADELAEAFMWDGEYERAHELAGDLTEFYARHGIGMDGDISFGKWLGIRGALAAVMSNAARRRVARRARKEKKPAEHPVSRSTRGDS